MKRLIFVFIITILLSSCNDRGVDRLKQFQELYQFNSPICQGGVCVE